MRSLPRRQTGMTLVELMIVMAMTVVIAGALGVAFGGELSLQRSQEAARAGAATPSSGPSRPCWPGRGCPG